jgi:hypothetical protein
MPHLTPIPPYFKQDTDFSCGAVVAQMVLAWYGIRESELHLMQRLHTSKTYGTHHNELIHLFTAHGLDHNTPTTWLIFWHCGKTPMEHVNSGSLRFLKNHFLLGGSIFQSSCDTTYFCTFCNKHTPHGDMFVVKGAPSRNRTYILSLGRSRSIH